jgi:catechol 2,3-dioxygenase-like lactoylglutathione lyase family enzyme
MRAGFREALANVPQLEQTAEEVRCCTGWEQLLETDTDEELLRAWGLGAGCRGREVLLGCPGTDVGYLRLLELSGVEQQPIRSNPLTWDTGGLLDLNIRVADMARRFDEFSRRGWYANSDPVTWRFGDKLVSEWLALRPDGLAFALIERLDPPLEASAVPDVASHIFNSSQVVADMAPALLFYEEILGFKKLLHIRQPLATAPGENVLCIPHNLVHQLDVEIAILSPGSEMEGSIELIRIHGLQGRDFSENAQPPNLGMLSLRFPVPDIAVLEQRLEQSGYPLAHPTVDVRIEPYGNCRLLAVQAPDGAWLEFYQSL